MQQSIVKFIALSHRHCSTRFGHVLANRPRLRTLPPPHSYGNQRLQRQFDGLLMMGMVIPETCSAVSVRQSNKFYDWLLHLVGCFYLRKLHLVEVCISLPKPGCGKKSTLSLLISQYRTRKGCGSRIISEQQAGVIYWCAMLGWGQLTLRWLMSYIYGATILDVSRSYTTTQHSR